MHPSADKTYQKAMDYVDEVFRAKSAVRWYYGAGKVIAGGNFGEQNHNYNNSRRSSVNLNIINNEPEHNRRLNNK